MAVKIRLARGGAKKRPFYSIVVADVRSPRDGRFIEKIGRYNPMLDKENPERVVIKEDRAKHWLSTGAQPSDRVAILFGRAGLIEPPKPRENPQKSQPKAKAQERAKERAEKEEAARAAAEEAAAAAEAEKAAAAEAPAEEAPAEEAASGEAAAETATAEEAPAEEAAAEETKAE